MQCSRIECKKTYDLKCLSISTDVFETYTKHYKNEWICPECVCLVPKGDNSNTPVRDLNRTFEGETFVNMNRGSGGSKRRAQCARQDAEDAEDDMVVEIRAMRSEIASRFDQQAERFQQMWNIVCENKNEINEMKTKIVVLENRISTFEGLENKLQELTSQNHLLLEQLGANTTFSKSSEGTYAQAVGATGTKSSACNIKVVDTEKCGATKTTFKSRTPAQPNVLISTTEQRRDVNGDLLDHNGRVGMEESNNNNNRRKLPAKMVLRGENETLNLEAIERKKHLHIWRLEPNTTVEQIQKHVESLCGLQIKVKVEKIVHKTKRDYASFIVGVPEKMFDKISHPQAWPRNTEFGEWIWFRRNSYKPKEGN